MRKYLRSVCRKIHISRISLSLARWLLFLSISLSYSIPSFAFSSALTLSYSARHHSHSILVICMFIRYICHHQNFILEIHSEWPQRRERRTFDFSFSFDFGVQNNKILSDFNDKLLKQLNSRNKNGAVQVFLPIS